MAALRHRSHRAAVALALVLMVTTLAGWVGSSLDDELSSIWPADPEILIAETDNGGG